MFGRIARKCPPKWQHFHSYRNFCYSLLITPAAPQKTIDPPVNDGRNEKKQTFFFPSFRIVHHLTLFIPKVSAICCTSRCSDGAIKWCGGHRKRRSEPCDSPLLGRNVLWSLFVILHMAGLRAYNRKYFKLLRSVFVLNPKYF